MSKILGLDLGTNSIGWAVVDDTADKILGTGVRIFPEGVENLGQGNKEKSKNAGRRESRQSRRQFFRKRLRKIKLLEILIDLEMCPLSKDELQQWKYYDKSKGKAGNEFPASKKFKQWLRLNPYELRVKALNEELTNKELGRVFYHMIQRRGFISNRKSKEEGKIYSGKDNIAGIDETKKQIKKNTLGSFLYTITPKENQPYKTIVDENGKELRARARYTLREMYVDEFEKIWAKQAGHLKLNSKNMSVKKIRLVGNPYRYGKKEKGLKKRLQFKINYLKNKEIKSELLIDKNNLKNTKLISETQIPLKDFLAGGEIIKQEDSLLFYQRPLRSQKALLAKCTFESRIYYDKKNKKWIFKGPAPCPVSHPDFELKRAFEFINNIEYGHKQKLNDQQREIVLNLINSQDKNFDFANIPKALHLTYEKFNFDDKHRVPGNYTHKHLKPLFPDDVWFREYKIWVNGEEKTEFGYERIWHCFYFYKDNDKLIVKLQNNFGLEEKNVEKVIGKLQEDGSRKGGIILKEGYRNLSLKAIRNILPFLQKGYQYSNAVLLGGVKNAFGNRWDYFKTSWEEIEKYIIRINSDKDNKEGEAIEKIKAFLANPNNDFGFKNDDKAFLDLYHHSQETSRKEELQNELGEVKNLRNPIVQQVLFDLKKLVYELSKEYLENGEHFGQIKVELARDLKQSRQNRIDQWFANTDRERENTEAREVLDEFGLAHSRENIHKYLLWKELKEQSGTAVCPYTGLTINITDLFGKENKFQIEHIIPYSKSLDDSFGNKTLCDAEENGKKGERTPFEFYGSDDKNWESISERAFRVLPYNKAKRFTSKTAHKTDFLSRQLNDTRYISKEAKDYLSQICKDVRVFPGQLTADLRHKWGLDTILAPPVEVNNENLSGSVWAKTAKNGKSIDYYPVFNKRPKNKKGEFVIVGEVKKEKFTSKFLNLKVDVEGIKDGKYFAKIKVRQIPLELVRIYKPMPGTVENEILLFGKVDKDKKFTSKFLTQKIDANAYEPDKNYWAKFKVDSEKTIYIHSTDKKGIPKPKKDNILLKGRVKDGVFSSKIYTCKTNVQDGWYYALLKVDTGNNFYYEIVNKRPDITDDTLIVSGNVINGGFLSEIDRTHLYEVDTKEEGPHWAVFKIQSNPFGFVLMKNAEPKYNKNIEELIKGSILLTEIIEVGKETGEIVNEEQKNMFFPAKNRSDNRHHAIDALVVAMTETSFLQKLSTYNANKKAKYRGKQFNKASLSFDMPWDTFRNDAEIEVNKILISHKKVNRIINVKTTRIKKNGKLTISKGIAARGQLHKEFVYGKRKSPDSEQGYHIRKSLESLQTKKHIYKIVDPVIRKLIFQRVDELGGFTGNKEDKIPKNTFFKVDDNNVKQPQIFLPNKKGEPVPIKKVRMREEISNAEKLKDHINQYVNPRNNHHVLIYKNKDGIMKEDVVTFWTAVERRKQKQAVVQIPPEDSDGTIVTTLQINDMFLLGLNEEDVNWGNPDTELLRKHLYRVQKLSSMFFEFRLNMESTLNRDFYPYYIRIQSFGDGKTGWITHKPIKVKISITDKIEKF